MGEAVVITASLHRMDTIIPTTDGPKAHGSKAWRAYPRSPNIRHVHTLLQPDCRSKLCVVSASIRSRAAGCVAYRWEAVVKFGAATGAMVEGVTLSAHQFGRHLFTRLSGARE